MNPPKPVTGNNAAATWLNRLLAFAISLRILPGPGYRVKRGPGGTQIEFISKGGGGGSSTVSGVIKMYRIKEVFYDVYRCHEWTGTIEGSADVFVAKNPKLRNSVNNEVLDGVSTSYVYDATYVLRIAADGNQQEAQDVVPRILLNDVISAWQLPVGITVSKVPTEANIIVTWVDLNTDGRAWCSRAGDE